MRSLKTVGSWLLATVGATSLLLGCGASRTIERADDASTPARAQQPQGSFSSPPSAAFEETSPTSAQAPQASEDELSAAPIQRSEGASAANEVAPSRPASPSYQGESRRSSSGALKSSPSVLEPRPRERPGLGTSWGETRVSYVNEVRFERHSRNAPTSLFQFNYNDRDGIFAQTGESSLEAFSPSYVRSPNGFVSVEIVDPNGNPLLGLSRGDRTYVVGRDGDRYAIRIVNHDRLRYEVVASVDGLDVIDGTKASFGKRGYILDAYGSLLIEGFRRTSSAIAAFRFGAVSDSYAARTSGDRHVGVIGVALFEERHYEPTYSDQEIRRRETADPFPGQFARPPAPRREQNLAQ